MTPQTPSKKKGKCECGHSEDYHHTLGGDRCLAITSYDEFLGDDYCECEEYRPIKNCRKRRL